MKLRAAFILGAVSLGIACAGTPQHRGVEPPPAAVEARFTILQINDVYKIEGLENGAVGGLAGAAGAGVCAKADDVTTANVPATSGLAITSPADSNQGISGASLAR